MPEEHTHATNRDGLSSSLNRLWRRVTTQSNGTPDDHGEHEQLAAKNDHPSSAPSPGKSKRRQQIYDAQKRHRNKKHEYIRSLESELNKLRNMESVVAAQREKLAKQNEQMRQLLAESNVHDVASTQTPLFATVSVEHDSNIHHERLFLHNRSLEAGREEPEETTWSAIDFILALEWPCRSHVRHPIMSPPGANYAPCGSAEYNGHGLTATATIVDHSLLIDHTHDDVPPSSVGIDEAILRKWQIPYAEVERLIHLAEQLALDADVLTPAQMYAAIKAKCPSTSMLRSLLVSMKSALSGMLQCEGYGATVYAATFHRSLDAALKRYTGV